MKINRQKLQSMPLDKIARACDIHAREYKRLKAAGRMALAEKHKSLLHDCAYVAVSVNE